MAARWVRLDARGDREALRAPVMRAALSFLRPGEVTAYRSSAGTIALMLPLGAWLADRQSGIEWAPAPAAPGPTRGESVALLSAAVEGADLETLKAAARSEGADATMIALAPTEPAPAGAVPSGTLTLALGRAPLSLPVYRIDGAPPALHESPAALRKRAEEPGHLRERERWFKSRTEPGR